MAVPMLIKDILTKLEHTLLQRRDNYAPPYENFRRIAARMTLTLEHKLRPGARINIIEAALLADDIKMGRIGHDLKLLYEDEAHEPHVDNFHDKAGYAVIDEEMLGQRRAGHIDIYGNVTPPSMGWWARLWQWLREGRKHGRA